VKIGGDEGKIKEMEELFFNMDEYIGTKRELFIICKNGSLRELKEKINSSNINSRDRV